jgi:hypothetical protein
VFGHTKSASVCMSVMVNLESRCEPTFNVVWWWRIEAS